MGSVISREEAEKNAKNTAYMEGQKLVTTTLGRHEEAQNHAINRNMMIGEDFRSQALLNYHKIIFLQE